MNETKAAIYLNDWASSGEAGMLRDFGIEKKALEGASVVVASYTYENYEGSAYVLLERDGKLFEVHGGHCSCYGLSESSYSGDTQTQWKMDEVEREALIHRLNKGTWGEEGSVADVVRAAIAAPKATP